MARAATVRLPLELSDDRRMALRVQRLGLVSLIALGLIWWTAAVTLTAAAWVGWMLLAGWVLMPVTLFASLSRPRLRYALVVPASLVGLGLLAILVWWPPAEPLPALGWGMMAFGVLLGGGMGLWFWYRLIPVPRALDDPYAPGRWALIAVHVGLIVAGWVLAALGG